MSVALEKKKPKSREGMFPFYPGGVCREKLEEIAAFYEISMTEALRRAILAYPLSNSASIK
jgi:hypothetical protein